MSEATRRVRITAGSASAEATLDGSRTATAVWAALPISAPAQTWGDGISFDIGPELAPQAPEEADDEDFPGYRERERAPRGRGDRRRRRLHDEPLAHRQGEAPVPAARRRDLLDRAGRREPRGGCHRRRGDGQGGQGARPDRAERRREVPAHEGRPQG